jgi:hypothetical protein
MKLELPDFGTGLRRYLARNPSWRSDGEPRVSLAALIALFA